MKKYIVFSIFVILSTLLFGCGRTKTAAGAGGETTNGVVAKVVNNDGSPAIGAKVILREYNYVSSISGLPSIDTTHFNAVTDNNGCFGFEGLAEGNYRIEVKNDSAAVLLQFDIDLEEKLDLGASSLGPYAKLQGTIATDSPLTDTQYYVQVPGMERLWRVQNDGSFIADDLPEGDYQFFLVSKINPDKIIVDASGVRMTSGSVSSLRIDPAWSNYKRVYLNTTESGAGVSEDVYNFPLLVRLNDFTFDFQTLSAGEFDVQFFNQAGGMLAQQVESLDVNNQVATIWVNVDTVFGASDTQWVEMRWGNTTAAVQQSSELVFDTELGFTGVWHLADASQINNSTNESLNGENYGVTAVEGLIGKGFDFQNGGYALLSPESFESVDSQVTISLWQYASDYKINQRGTIFDGRTSDSASDHRLLAHLPWCGTDSTCRVYWDAGSNPLDSGRVSVSLDLDQFQGEWRHWVFVKNASTGDMRIYLNGSELWYKSGMYSSMSGIGVFKLGGDLANPSIAYSGYIDEFRVSRVERSEAWIKLSYENQKDASTVVKMGERP